MSLHIVLCEPEIPQNTGNISRTCAAIGAHLHLVEPMGFRIDESKVRRAGLDYWPQLSLRIHPSIAVFFETECSPEKIWYISRKGSITYSDINFAGESEPCYIMFGRESVGLPDSLLEPFYNRTVRVPMRQGIRSLNLSNTVAILAYEFMRQKGFPDLDPHGSLDITEHANIRRGNQ